MPIVVEQTLTFRYGECRRPLRAQDVEADAAVTVDVGMVDFRRERDLRRKRRQKLRARRTPFKSSFGSVLTSGSDHTG